MARTDKQAPARVKLARGERPKSKRYEDTCAFWVGRDGAWKDEAKTRSGEDRARLRADVRRALTADDVEDVDILPAATGGQAGTNWVVY